MIREILIPRVFALFFIFWVIMTVGIASLRHAYAGTTRRQRKQWTYHAVTLLISGSIALVSVLGVLFLLDITK